MHQISTKILERCLKRTELQLTIRASRYFSVTPQIKKNESTISYLDVLADVSKPLNNIETITLNCIIYSSGIVVKNKTSLLISNNILEIEPKYKILHGFIVQFDMPTLQLFQLITPQPDLLVIGLGPGGRILSPDNINFLQSLGLKMEISDTINAGKCFNLLATERPNQIVGLLLPSNK